MGGGNPIKQILNSAQDVTLGAASAVARGVGASGAADFIDKGKDALNRAGGELVDQVDGTARSREEDYQKKKAGEDAQAAADQQTATDNAAAEANRQTEAARMASGSKSRTLLTSSSGLDDEDGVSKTARRTLSAR